MIQGPCGPTPPPCPRQPVGNCRKYVLEFQANHVQRSTNLADGGRSWNLTLGMGSLGGKWAPQVTPESSSVRKARSWTPPLGPHFETSFEIFGFVFACFFKRPPEQHFIDCYSISGSFLMLFFEVFGAGSP